MTTPLRPNLTQTEGGGHTLFSEKPDFLIKIPFKNQHKYCKNPENLYVTSIFYAHNSIKDDKFCKAGDFSPRVSRLDDIPSPYLEGYLDEFLAEPKLSPLLESNRGCPFSCTFCVDGINDRSKVYSKEVSRFE